MNITKEDKQLELLRWHQDCLDHYKGLRFQIPVLIITIQLSAFAFIVKDLAEGGKLETGLGLLLVSLISAIGLRALYLVRGQYRSISEDMDHLREKLAMDGLDYFA